MRLLPASLAVAADCLGNDGQGGLIGLLRSNVRDVPYSLDII